MRDKKIKLIYFSTQGSEVKSVNLTWKRILSVMFSSFVVMLLLVGSSIALFTDAYQNVRITSLSKTNLILNNQLQDLNRKLAGIETQMQTLNETRMPCESRTGCRASMKICAGSALVARAKSIWS